MTFSSEFLNEIALPALFENLPSSSWTGNSNVDGMQIAYTVGSNFNYLVLHVCSNTPFSLDQTNDIRDVMISIGEYRSLTKSGQADIAIITNRVVNDQNNKIW